MTTDAKPLSFGHHALAVLGTAMLASTLLSVIFTLWLVIATNGRPLEVSWFAMLAAAMWFSIFLIMLPGASVVLSLLWPVTRRGSAFGGWLCIGTGAVLGAVFSPFASPRIQGPEWVQISVLALTGAAIAAIYLLLAKQLRSSRA